MTIKIVIADDDVLIREGLKVIFDVDPDFEVIGTVSDGQEAFEACLNHSVDLVLMDVRMPNLNGVEATKKISEETQTKILILSTFDEEAFVKEAFKNGASGYLLKNSPPDQIKRAILSVFSGHVVMQKDIMAQFNAETQTSDYEKLQVLTTREIDVVKLIAQGLTNGEIADTLYLTEGTVKNAVSSILSKLALKHRTQIAIFYLKK